MTYEQAARFIGSHGFQTKPCTSTGFISAEMIYTHQDHPGKAFSEWQEVRLTKEDIKDWLGY